MVNGVNTLSLEFRVVVQEHRARRQRRHKSMYFIVVFIYNPTLTLKNRVPEFVGQCHAPSVRFVLPSTV